MTEDRPTLIYYVQTVLNTFKRDIEQGFVTRDKEYAITLLEKAMKQVVICVNDAEHWKLDNFDRAKVGYDKMDEHQNDIWNAAIKAAANKVESAGNILLAHSVRELKK